MKIYKLTVREVEKDPIIVVSSFVAPRHDKKIEFYISKEKAEIRKR